MGPTYDFVNLVSSFGFSEIWRAQCVGNLNITQNAIVADFMAGSGECWPYLNSHIRPNGRILSVDISPVMCERQRRRAQKLESQVEIRCENALYTNLPDTSVDFVVSAFGLKTFNSDHTQKPAYEIFRILRPGGRCSFTEISIPNAGWLRWLYSFYIGKVIPSIGRLVLKDIDCYKMLGVYTEAFGSCIRVKPLFEEAGFSVISRKHFLGSATSLILTKPGRAIIQGFKA